MKLILIASTALTLVAGAASAAGERQHERPDNLRSMAIATEVQAVVASSVYSSEELSRWNLSGDDVIKVTVFPSTGVVDKATRDD